MIMLMKIMTTTTATTATMMMTMTDWIFDVRNTQWPRLLVKGSVEATYFCKVSLDFHKFHFKRAGYVHLQVHRPCELRCKTVHTILLLPPYLSFITSLISCLSYSSLPPPFSLSLSLSQPLFLSCELSSAHSFLAFQEPLKHIF